MLFKPKGRSWLAWVWAEWRLRSGQAGRVRLLASVGLFNASSLICTQARVSVLHVGEQSLWPAL